MQWINIDTRAPDKDIDGESEIVAVLKNGHEKHFAYILESEDHIEEDEWWCPAWEEPITGITHWMYIPDLNEQVSDMEASPDGFTVSHVKNGVGVILEKDKRGFFSMTVSTQPRNSTGFPVTDRMLDSMQGVISTYKESKG